MKKLMMVLGLAFAWSAGATEITEADFPSICGLPPTKIECGGAKQSSGCVQVCTGGKQARCIAASCWAGWAFTNDRCYCE